MALFYLIFLFELKKQDCLRGDGVDMDNICKHLRPILNYALENDNQIMGKSEGWSNADLVYDMLMPLNIKEISKLPLDTCVIYWKNEDTHYSLQEGY